MTSSGENNPASVSVYQERFSSYYKQCGMVSVMAGGVLWVEHGPALIPAGPVADDHTICAADTRKVLAAFRRGLLLYYTDGFDRAASTSPWYAVVCKHFSGIDTFSTNTRSKIRRGLRNCGVEKITADYLSQHGYPTYMRANARYFATRRKSCVRLKSQKKFEKQLAIAREFPDILEYWGIFCGGQLAGYAQVLVFGNTEAFYEYIVLDPEYFRNYSSYALIYHMNAHYLQERGLAYVNDGFRRVMHQTQFQEFLTGQMGFERAPLNLHVVYRPWVAVTMAIPWAIRRSIGRLVPGFAAMNTIHDAAASRNT